MIIKQKRINLIMRLRRAKYIILFMIIVVTTCFLFTTCFFIQYRKDANIGISFVETLYNARNLSELKQNHTERLKKVATDEIVGRVSLELNNARLDYTYYGMSNATKEIKPVYIKVTNQYIEFTISLDGELDGKRRAIWFDTMNGKISKFQEATLLPFAKDEVDEK